MKKTVTIGEYELVLAKGLIQIYRTESNNSKSLIRCYDVKNILYEEEEFAKIVERFKKIYNTRNEK